MTLPRWRPWAYYLIGIVGMIAISFAGSGLRGLMAIGVGATSTLWLLLFVCLAWKRTDEAAREAHKFAYFWGGGFGVFAAFFLLMLLVSAAPPPDPARPREKVSVGFKITQSGDMEILPPRGTPVAPRLPGPDEVVVKRKSLATTLIGGVMLGAFFVIMMQSLGYFVTWIGWWVSKR